MSSHGTKIAPGLSLLPGGAALLTEENVLVVADLHLGVEAALEYQGLSIPRVQTRKIEEYLLEVIADVSPSKVIVAGDLKHNFSRNLVQEWEDVRRFVSRVAREASLEVIKGNHDNYLAVILREFEIPLRLETAVSDIRILHGHSGSLDGRLTVIGHIHPSLRLRDRIGAPYKDRCFLYSKEHRLLVLPAQSLAAYGTDVLGRRGVERLSPLLPMTGLSEFVPIMFSRDTPLKFPRVAAMMAEREGRHIAR